MPLTNYYSVSGELLGEKSGGARTDYLTDGLGNITATVNQAGALVNRYSYRPYGGLLSETSSGADPSFQWVGLSATDRRARSTRMCTCELGITTAPMAGGRRR